MNSILREAIASEETASVTMIIIKSLRRVNSP